MILTFPRWAGKGGSRGARTGSTANEATAALRGEAPVPRTDRRDGSTARTEAMRYRWFPLVPLAAVVVILASAGVLPTWPGLVHLVALPPLDLYGDIRVLLTTTSTVPSLVLSLLAVFVLRTVVLSLMMGGLTRDRVALAATFYGVLLVPWVLAAELVYMAETMLYARLFWFGLIAVAVFALLWAPAPWAAVRRHREIGRGPRIRDAFTRTWREGPRLSVLLGYVVAVVGVGLLAQQFPALTIPLVPLSAAATAVAITGLTLPVPARPFLRLGATALALVLLSTVWIITRGGESVEATEPREGSLLLMSGINSRSGSGDMFGTDPAFLGYSCEQTYYFSYAGQGEGQPQGQALCPIHSGSPYTEGHTQRPFDEQVEVFAEQVQDLPRPLVVAGHSHGVWVAWKAAASGAAPEVDALILVGAFPESTGGYRAPGEDGKGRPASDLLHLLIPLGSVFGFDLAPDAPGPRELLGSTERPAEIFALPLPEHTRTLKTPSSTDLPLKPSGWRMDVDRNACPIRTPHAYLPTTPAYYNEVNRFLDGEPPPACPVAFDWGGPLTLPFGTPTVLVEHPD